MNGEWGMGNGKLFTIHHCIYTGGVWLCRSLSKGESGFGKLSARGCVYTYHGHKVTFCGQ